MRTYEYPLHNIIKIKLHLKQTASGLSFAYFGYPYHADGMKGAIMSKFLTYEERLNIAKGLKECQSFGAIAKQIGKDRTTVAKEVKNHSYEKKSGRPGYPYNACRHREDCKLKLLCEQTCTHQSAYKCSICPICNHVCTHFEEEVCTARLKPPYVCNSCASLDKCTLKVHL